MREVEVKFRVNDVESLLAALRARRIELSEPFFEDDQAYAPDGWKFGDSKLGVSFTRLRTVGERYFFALKEPAQNPQDCLEFETEIADREAMHGAILRMGFQPTVRVVKTRRMATLKECLLCVDNLEGVGGFLELERMVPDDDDAGRVQAGAPGTGGLAGGACPSWPRIPPTRPRSPGGSRPSTARIRANAPGCLSVPSVRWKPRPAHLRHRGSATSTKDHSPAKPHGTCASSETWTKPATRQNVSLHYVPSSGHAAARSANSPWLA